MGKEVVYKPAQEQKQIYPGGALTPAKFMPSLYEWLAWKGQRIIERAAAVNNLINVYSCPADTMAFIYSYSFILMQEAVATGEHYLRLDKKYLFVLDSSATTGEHTEVTANLAIPLIMRAGETITVESQDANVRANACIFGFEVKNKDLPSL